MDSFRPSLRVSGLHPHGSADRRQNECMHGLPFGVQPVAMQRFRFRATVECLTALIAPVPVKCYGAYDPS